eukprot:GEZU01008704.1.p1 GENE.GEZU01008704.1~~GEZU01008704.1.p1  ORF type:complete len:120 (-),score=19.32 GEZU01008704.1:14-373(-)
MQRHQSFLFSTLKRMSSTTARPVYESIKAKLTAALKPVSLNIVDESYKHAGHAAMKGLAARETHFLVEIVSDEFKGKTLLQRHKMVNELLAEELRTGVHALSIQTRTPEEEERKKQQQQ